MSASADRQRKVSDRRAKVLRLRVSGLSWSEIAGVTGHKTAAAAAQDAARALRERKSLLAEERDLLIALEQERLDAAEKAANTVLVNAKAAGEGELVLKAVDRIVRIAQRRSALSGFDAPKRQADQPTREADNPLDGIRDELADFRQRKRGIPGG